MTLVEDFVGVMRVTQDNCFRHGFLSALEYLGKSEVTPEDNAAMEGALAEHHALTQPKENRAC